MKNFHRSVVAIVLLVSLVACGNQELETAQTEIGRLHGEVSKLRIDLATEIKVKRAHAVAEEKYKQRLRQAERDLKSAHEALLAAKGGKK